jgi:hypothetical protein
LTTPPPASAQSAPLPLNLFVEGNSSPVLSGPPRRGVFGRDRASDQTSDASCRAPLAARTSRTVCEEPEPLPPPSRQQGQLSRPEAPFIDKCSAHIRRQRPPPISQLCRCDPASDARSLLRCSRTERLDPRRLHGLFARGLARTMRRLSTSAIDTIIEHNRLIDRTPLTPLEVALEQSSVQAHRGQLSPPLVRLRHG